MLDELLRLEAYKRSNPNELTVQQFLMLEKEIKHPDSETISDEYFDFKLWYRGLPSRQERFADLLVRRLPKTEGLRVLEVGCGRTAKLSRILSQKGFVMTCIDPTLEKSYCDGIEGIKGKFDYKRIDLSTYDYVIAQEPCDATEHVVRACISQHKPFIMALCGVPHKLLSGETPKNINEWYSYLVNISKNEIKFSYIMTDALGKTPIIKSNYS